MKSTTKKKIKISSLKPLSKNQLIKVAGGGRRVSYQIAMPGTAAALVYGEGVTYAVYYEENPFEPGT
jgi:hypothetical protein